MNGVRRFLFKVFLAKNKLFPHRSFSKFPPFKFARDLVMRGLISRDPIDVNDHQMYIDDNDSLCLGLYAKLEPFETDLVSQYVKPGTTVVDIGANIGYYSLLFARGVGKEGKVIAFEPDRENARLLAANVALNGYENVTVEQKAVWDKKETLKLFKSLTNCGDHSVLAADSDRPSDVVEAVSLDEYLEGSQGPIDIIKMDIQGAEFHALRGMVQTLERNPGVMVFMEFCPRMIEGSGVRCIQVVNWLKQMGFQILVIDEGTRSLIPFDPANLEGLLTNNPEWFVNLLCTRRTQIVRLHEGTQPASDEQTTTS